MNSLRSRTVVKSREANSEHLAKELWHAEVMASMLTHLDCAMQLVKVCDAIRFCTAKPTLADYKPAYEESRADFRLTKRRLARMKLIESGVALDHAAAQLLLG